MPRRLPPLVLCAALLCGLPVTGAAPADAPLAPAERAVRFERAVAAADDRVDLLTVLAHELGHLLGLDHEDDPTHFMAERLAPGTRTLPNEDDPTILDRVFAENVLPELMT